MPNPKHPLTELLERDRRFQRDAYIFVDNALCFAQTESAPGSEQADGLGTDLEEGLGEDLLEQTLPSENYDDSQSSEEESHITGQQLCEAIRRYALQQYGLMARSVLNHWGIRSTGDFGEIVFNLIDIGRMRKTESDRREDFQDVFDFDTDLGDPFSSATIDSSEEHRS